MSNPYTQRLNVDRPALASYANGIEDARNAYDRHKQRIDAHQANGEKRAGRPWAIENAEITTGLAERYARLHQATGNAQWHALELVATALTQRWLKQAEAGK